MAFLPKLQLFVWIACERPHASFAQACRKHKQLWDVKAEAAACLRRNTNSTPRTSDRDVLLAAAVFYC
jgi:hypothetical protein